MPNYRGITLALQSQFDIETIPEYTPRPQSFYTAQNISDTVPLAIDDRTSTCSVYIPVLPGSQFWISYRVSPPVPIDQQFLFKLFINGAHIVSWGVGEEQGRSGKMMFGLYEMTGIEDNKKRIEKRALCFTPPNGMNGEWTDVLDAFDHSAQLTVRVYRAHGRKRMERNILPYSETSHGRAPRGVNLVNAGRAGAEVPKRFYKFALIDSTDKPYATFQFYYRTWEQIRDLGLLPDESLVSEDGTEMSVIEPFADECHDDGETRLQRIMTTPTQRSSDDEDGTLRQISPRAYVPSGTPKSASSLVKASSTESPSQRHSVVDTPPQFYQRLSVPPSCKLEPDLASTRTLAQSPRKRDSNTITRYLPHPIYSVDEWDSRTPSPIKSVRDGISTPPMTRRTFTPTAWLGALTSTWRRKGMTSADGLSSTEDDG